MIRDHGLKWFLTFLVACVSVSGRSYGRSEKPADTIVDTIVGTWKSELIESEWGPLRMELTFANDGSLEVKILPRAIKG
jgi:hypothetical protein